MNFLELVKKRQSVRKYSDKPVEREKLVRCLEAARLAPSASNGQPWKFVVVDQEDLVAKVATKTMGPLWTFNKFVPQSKIIVAIVIEKMKMITAAGATIKDKEYALFDIGIAAEHFCLQAADEGLGTCMLGWFDEDGVKQLLNVPFNKRIGLLITLGYPPEDYPVRMKIRKDFDEIVSFNRYKSKL
jgi:nitroreductase